MLVECSLMYGKSSIHDRFGIKLNKTNGNYFNNEMNYSGLLGGKTLEYHDMCWLEEESAMLNDHEGRTQLYL